MRARKSSRPRKKSPGLSGSFEGKVERLAHRGDGVVTVEGKAFHVPFTVPGDEVHFTVRDGRTSLTQMVHPGPHRVDPHCTHFGVCGGCDLQHMAPKPYLDWKEDQVRVALAQRGFENVDVRSIQTVAPGARRRATFAATRQDGAVVLGYHRRASGRLVDIKDCPVLLPAFSAALPGLRLLADLLLPRSARGQGRGRGALTLAAMQSEAGLDIAITSEQGEGVELNLEQRQDLSALMEAQDWARLSFDDELLVARRTPTVKLGGISVTPPPGAFLQACETSQNIIADLVCEAVGAARNVADLFSGCGTLTFPLALRARVFAVEGDAAVMSALAKGAAHSHGLKGGGLKEITTAHRDLVRAPLMPSELKKFDAVVFDPPRAGAKNQVEALAQSRVPVIVGVSCAPATFARDARVLVDGGYHLRWVAPVDQFLWSHHLELVGVFERA